MLAATTPRKRAPNERSHPQRTPPRPGVSAATGTLEFVVTALYRRYRPENFAELIGQTQVTDPLRTALRSDRVNHAYLFSGPRGCGKTTSARILARCLNCAEGPTDTPCGTCASCIELSRDGGGSLDVVEIDAASHNGVDDARDLRERAVFAPARDRYKIFILDEAHMVTPQGFNALLKIVEEPPEHVKFIFATTEPEKVIGTIRSRTHHYPFRLVPPAQMLEYVHRLSDSERVSVEPGVLPLVVRAGGGSVRDTLSLLDQLIAGSEGSTVQYERAVALLGFTHGTLLSESVDALGARDPAAAFAVVDRVIQTGQDPRRFVEDLLERLRDLIIVSAVRAGRNDGGSAEAAAAVLRGIQPDELEQMAGQAATFGAAELSRAADVVNAALTEMTGATSPRLHLELMIARVLIPASDDTERGALVRVERLERRVGVETRGAEDSRDPGNGAFDNAGIGTRDPAAAGASHPASPSLPAEPAQPASVPEVHSAPPAPVATPPAATASPRSTTAASAVTAQQMRDAWPEILDVVEKAKRTAWMVVYTSKVLDLAGDVLYLSFVSENDVASFKQQGVGDGVSEYLRRAIVEVLGIRVKFVARVDAAAHADSAPAVAASRVHTPAPTTTARTATAPTTPAPTTTAPPVTGPTTTWATVSVPDAVAPGQASVAQADFAPRHDGPPDIEPPAEADREPEPEFEPAPPAALRSDSERPSAAPRQTRPVRESPSAPVRPELDKRRYGESVVREILGASFIEELAVQPRVTPRGD
ncbi:MAG: polymerase subunit gamma and tau [Microbacteriaceae bacterium]|nr:polymerase subunit gamma and tau [Microbacteriaceae bacterium]